MQVTIGDYCTDSNDGAPNEAFCHDGSWAAEPLSGATLDMLVADSCGDADAWCRDDPNHLDLAENSLNRFVLGGKPVGDLCTASWNNRQISWSFAPAPNYSRDINLGFVLK